LAQNSPGCLRVWGRTARLVLQNSGCRWMCRNMWRCPPGAKLCGSGRYLALANVDPAEAGVALLHYLPLRPVIGPPRPDTSCGNTTCDYREFEASLAPAHLALVEDAPATTPEQLLGMSLQQTCPPLELDAGEGLRDSSPSTQASRDGWLMQSNSAGVSKPTHTLTPDCLLGA